MVLAADARLRADLAVGLKGAGYAVELASSGRRAIELASVLNLHAAIISLDLIDELFPRLNELRARVRRLILLDSKEDSGGLRIPAVNVADAVVSQPIELRALLAALRDNSGIKDVQGPDAGLLAFEAGTIDAVGRTFHNADGREVALTRAEFNLLHTLARNAGRVLSRDQLLQAASGRRAEAHDRSIDMLVGRLRRKVERDPRAPRVIIAVPGIGYKMGTPVDRRLAPMPLRVKMPPILSDRPSIAVLPFENLSPGSTDDYFAEGVVDDIITALSLLPWLFVIARGSSFAFKDHESDPYKVGTDLGVRYILQGSVRRDGGRIRITGRLVDVATRLQLWAERYDGSVDDIFRLQHDVASGVIGAIGPKLQELEIQRTRRKKTANLEAYDYFLRGLASLHGGMGNGAREPLRMFYKAIELDPHFATPYGLASRCYVWRKANGWMSDRKKEIAETARLVERVTAVGKDDPVALSSGGFAMAYVVEEIGSGAAMIDRALALAPGLAEAWGWSGWVSLYLGEHARAIEHAARAMQLSPRDPNLWAREIVTAFGHYLMGRYDDAAVWSERAFLTQPRFPAITRLLAASHAMAGRTKDAHKALERAHNRGIEPIVPLSTIGNFNPLRPKDLRRYQEGLRKAGFPE